MTQHTKSDPKPQDLFRRGVESSRAGQSQAAIELWTQAIAAQPQFPEARYMLGAEYAQCERYADAAVQLTVALDQAPDLRPARVQLALLWLTLQAPSQCHLVAQPLLDLPKSSEYHQFGVALVALGEGDSTTAIQALLAARGLETDNVALARDMNLLLDALHAKSSAAEVGHQAAISAYAGQRL